MNLIKNNKTIAINAWIINNLSPKLNLLPGNHFRVLILVVTTILFLVSLTQSILAQGPPLSHFYLDKSHLPWASCYIQFDDAKEQKVGFFPVINEKTNAPLGINNYSNDININDPIVVLADKMSITNGTMQSRSINLDNNVILIFSHNSDTSKLKNPNPSLEEIIKMAIENNAAGIVMVGKPGSNPLFTVSVDNEIPAISICHNDAIAMLKNAGFDYDVNKMYGQKGDTTARYILPARLRLHIEGKFENIQTENFAYHYHPEMIASLEMQRLKKINEKSLNFLLQLFYETALQWNQERMYYFDDFDSKIFYTGYWGIGFSCSSGVYNVYLRKENDYGLAVHENTHALLSKNGLSYCSFFDEGIARYAEAIATGKDINNRPTVDFIITGKLFRLKEMLDFNIGINPEETKVGYPASGSFVEFMVDTFGKQELLDISSKNLNINKQNEILILEKPWLEWLQEKYGFETKYISNHLLRDDSNE